MDNAHEALIYWPILKASQPKEIDLYCSISNARKNMKHIEVLFDLKMEVKTDGKYRDTNPPIQI